jgi:Na+-driven multidrug efflux pump
VVSEIDAQTEVGLVYMRSLMRSQLRLALGITGLLVLTVGLLPLLFLLVPFLQHGRVLGVPVAWMLLGFGCYPVMVVLAIRYVRRAERNERDFHDLVGPR